MRKTLIAAAAALLSLCAHADEALLARPEVQDYLNQLSTTQNFDRAQLDALFTRVNLKPNIISILDRPSTSRPWYQFRDNFISKSRVVAGARFMRRYKDTFDAVQERYGVPAEVVAAVIGCETMYGRDTGSFRVLDVLATIAFDYPRRADFFKNELTEFMLLAREENEDPLSFMGSYAGAMGLPQFMPSSFRKYAVDWNGDQHRDIWGTPDDAIASVAHFLVEHGWQKNGEIMQPVNVSGEEIPVLLADKFNLHYTVGELMQKGVAPLSEVDPQQQAVLFALETEPGFTRHYIGYANFYAITRYNRSTLYASAVAGLANAIRTAYTEEKDLAVPEAKPAKASPKPAAKAAHKKKTG
ncbi:membrane-bound lytic murein transglycosylase B [Andreprevotia lacus DSM 23236]|jgi:membrane-bound lytic murein transglycosylase B|uniref:Membrane-bound lytic murein transglycosylase B n=1 Tax=Andreprevotia lacus DSM 23236 TaxID=1121001 RepID=A0A1W1XMM6_9NEIS|nr:lytic murein transglycosylase B [Andreprevotia lacus]SMC25095.1 membrane-bound lytic murein transglycosylase B [Andreprevotia lacus DSM 23236]